MCRYIPVITLILTLFASPALADFGDCMAEDYLEGFGSVEAGTNPFGPIRQLTCIVEFEFEHMTPGGPRRIRGIRDASSDWGFEPGALAEVERGARRAAEAMASLGNFRVDDITILILDDEFSPISEPREGTVGALTSSDDTGGECIVTAYMLGRAGNPDYVAHSVAHEIFHCIQLASLSPEQTATLGPGASGSWWGEGSAEHFAGLALPEAGDLHDRASAFNEAVEGEVPLYGQSYGMAVFFHWYHAQTGAGALMTFLSGMSPSGGAASQMAAMRDALNDSQWRRFVTDYSDRQISHPGGAPLALNPPGGEVLVFDGNVTRDFPMQPFVVSLGTAEYDCGRWRNTLRPANVNLGAQELSGGAWQDYPDEVDARDGGNGSYRLAGIATDENAQSFSIKAERTSSCEPCGGTREVDVCMVGAWQQIGGGAVEWMRSQGMPSNLTINQGPMIVIYEDDGTYWTVPFSSTMFGVFRHPRHTDTVRGEARAAAAGGRWSAEGGQLNVCQDSGGVSGQVTITSSRGSSNTMPIGMPGGGQLQHGYSCSEVMMDTSLDFPGMSPMTTQYVKISEE